jgi:hypothetical protein
VKKEFQVGQIWALHEGATTRIYMITGQLKHEEYNTYYISGPYVHPTLSEGQLQEFLEHAERVGLPIVPAEKEAS